MKLIQTRGYLAMRYGLCRQTISKLLHKIGITHAGHLAPLEIELFVKSYGTPEQLRAMQELLKS